MTLFADVAEVRARLEELESLVTATGESLQANPLNLNPATGRINTHTSEPMLVYATGAAPAFAANTIVNPLISFIGHVTIAIDPNGHYLASQGLYIAPKTGTYLVAASVAFGSSAAGTTSLSINNISTGFGIEAERTTVASISNDGISVAGLIPAASGNGIRMTFESSFAGNFGNVGQQGEPFNWLSVHLID